MDTESIKNTWADIVELILKISRTDEGPLFIGFFVYGIFLLTVSKMVYRDIVKNSTSSVGAEMLLRKSSWHPFKFREIRRELSKITEDKYVKRWSVLMLVHTFMWCGFVIWLSWNLFAFLIYWNDIL